MIRVTPAVEPQAFDAVVRQPGLRAISEMVGEPADSPRRGGRRFKKVADERSAIPADSFPPYWTEILDDLMEAYHHVCAYSCFRIHRVTGSRSADHMVAKSRAWDRVYEWTNYRLACSRLNSRKNDFEDVLDPFEIQDEWFELEFVGFQVKPGKGLDEATRARVLTTIQRLGLNDYHFRRERERDVLRYEAGVPYHVLVDESPFVARELKRQNRLRPDDRGPLLVLANTPECTHEEGERQNGP